MEKRTKFLSEICQLLLEKQKENQKHIYELQKEVLNLKQIITTFNLKANMKASAKRTSTPSEYCSKRFGDELSCDI